MTTAIPTRPSHPRPPVTLDGATSTDSPGRRSAAVETEPPPGPSPGAATRADWDSYLPFRAALVRSLERRYRDRDVAEDLAHDALIRAATSSPGTAAVDRPRAWLERIAINLYRDSRRKRVACTHQQPEGDPSPEPLGREPIPGDDPETSWVPTVRGFARASLLVDDLRSELEQLPARDRALLTRYYIEGKELPEAARLVGTDARLAKVWLYRARGALRSRMVMRSPLLAPGSADDRR